MSPSRAKSFDAWYKFADGMEFFYQMGTPHVRFEGEKGWIQVNYIQDALHPDKLQASDPALLTVPLGPDAIRFPLRGEKEDFIECVKTRGTPFRDIELAVNTMAVCHLGIIAYTLQRSLKWDAAKQQFPDDEEANRFLDRARLEAWQL